MSVYLNFNSLFLDEFSAVSNASKKDLNRFNYLLRISYYQIHRGCIFAFWNFAWHDRRQFFRSYVGSRMYERWKSTMYISLRGRSRTWIFSRSFFTYDSTIFVVEKKLQMIQLCYVAPLFVVDVFIKLQF